MLNLLDSHDTHRFFKEVDKSRSKMKAALALLYFFPGVPCIFYGTEILTEGGYDPDCRRCMDWSKADTDGEFKDIYSLLKNLARLRTTYRFSDCGVWIGEKDEMLVVEQTGAGDVVSLYINLTAESNAINGVTILPQTYAIFINEGVMEYE